MRIGSWLAIPILAVALCLGTGCEDPGPAEKAGQALDDAVDKIQHGDEGTLEKAGRKVDEAIEDAEDELEKMGEDS